MDYIRSFSHPLLILTWCGIGMLAAGCADYQWQDNFDDAMKMAAEQKKPLFVYYRNWLSADCTRMYNDVLNLPEVASELKGAINCQLEYNWEPNQEKMAQYRVKAVPGYVIVLPNGKYRSRTGVMSKERFVRFVRSALALGARKESTAKGGPPPPARK